MNSKYVLIGAAGLIVAGIGIKTLQADTYQTLTKATVVEDKPFIQKNAGGKDQYHYLLHVKSDEGDYYTLNVSESEQMPLAVLDDVISPGSELYFQHKKKGILGTKPKDVYEVTRFGSVDSNKVRVLHPWESSYKVKEQFAEELESQRVQAYHKAQLDMGRSFTGKMIW